MTRFIIWTFAFSVVVGVIFTMIYDCAKSEALREIADGGRRASAITITICFFALPFSLILGVLF